MADSVGTPAQSGPTVASGASKRGSHKLADAANCPRKWDLRYNRHLRLAPHLEPKWRMAGTIMHDSLAHRYAEALIEEGVYDTPSWWDGSTIHEVLAKSGEGYPDLIDLALDLYVEYPERWWRGTVNELDMWQPVSVEEQYQARVGDIDYENLDGVYDDEIITCRTDLVMRNRKTGHLWVVDHKSKSHAWGRKRDRLPVWKPEEDYVLSWQAMVNLHILRLHFRDEVVAGFKINRFTRSKPFDFDRNTIHIHQPAYDKARSLVRLAVQKETELNGMVAAGKSMPAHFWNCHGPFGLCDYAKLCNAENEAAALEVVKSDYKVAT